MVPTFCMSDVDPFDPFSSLLRPPKGQPPLRGLASFLPKPVESQPPPSLLASFLPKPAEPLSPERLASITSFLKQDQPLPTSPQKSLLQKLADHVTLGSRLITENRVNRAKSIEWIVRLRNIVQPLFGCGSPYIKGLEDIRKRCALSGIAVAEFSEITSIAAALADFLASKSGVASGNAVSRPSRPPATKNVFIIHGHDELNARRLADLVRESGLVPIVMAGQAGMGRVLTDKFETEASKCSFAFAVFTPDDLVTSGSQHYGQARPNVIYETGWFVARLGKERVVLLLRTGAEMHTDLQGVSRIQFAENISHAHLEIQRELRSAGLLV